MNLISETKHHKEQLNQPEQNLVNKTSLTSLCLSCWRSSYLSAMAFPAENRQNDSIANSKEDRLFGGFEIVKDIALFATNAVLHPLKTAFEKATVIVNSLVSSSDSTSSNKCLEQKNKTPKDDTSFPTATYIFAGLANITIDKSISQSSTEFEDKKKTEKEDLTSGGPIRDRNKLLAYLINGSTPQLGIATPISPARILEAISNGQISPIEREKLNCLDTFSESF